MKKKITIITISLIILLILGISFSNISNAAIEVKPGTSAHTNITATNSYQYCYDMRSSTSTLGNNTLDPHLTLNADWAAAAYLGASAYGNARDIDGHSVTIGETTYNSTTKNITGVMNMGNKLTQTSSLRYGYGTGYANRYNLEKNANTKYVEILNSSNTVENTKGQAFAEVSGWWGSTSTYVSSNTAFPIGIRTGIFGYNHFEKTTADVGKAAYGNGADTVTYRPVIWN